MSSARLDAVVVNYNAGEVLARSLDSVLGQAQIASVTLVDNGSSDGSLALPQVGQADELIQLPDNPGFATACNRGAEQGSADWIVFLNPDAWFEPGQYETLVNQLDGHPRAGLAGVEVLDERGHRQRATVRRLPSLPRGLRGLRALFAYRPPLDLKLDPAQASTAVPAVSGACMIVRREAFESVGGFDPSFRLHGEDLDMMRRMTDADWQIIWLPQIVVRHVQGVSSRSRPVWVHWQKHRSMLRYLRKHELPQRGWLSSVLARAGVLVRFMLTLPTVIRQHRR